MKTLTAFASLEVILKILFVDVGSKFTAWKWEYPEIQITTEGTIQETDPYQQANQIIKIIQDYQVNYLVLEREIEDHLPIREDNYFVNYLQILKIVLDYCHSNNIKGCVILPRTQQETRKWRESKNYCWKQNWNTNKYWCQAHQRREKEKVKTLDEIDAQCIQEIFYYRISKDPLLLKERERIFDLPMEIEEVEDYQKTKTERLNKYQIRQINYAQNQIQ